MTNDDRDPLRAAFDDYQRPRKELPTPAAPDDGRLAAVAGQTVALTHYDVGEHGISRHVEHVVVTRPITITEGTNQ